MISKSLDFWFFKILTKTREGIKYNILSIELSICIGTKYIFYQNLKSLEFQRSAELSTNTLIIFIFKSKVNLYQFSTYFYLFILLKCIKMKNYEYFCYSNKECNNRQRAKNVAQL